MYFSSFLSISTFVPPSFREIKQCSIQVYIYIYIQSASYKLYLWSNRILRVDFTLEMRLNIAAENLINSRIIKIHSWTIALNIHTVVLVISRNRDKWKTSFMRYSNIVIYRIYGIIIIHAKLFVKSTRIFFLLSLLNSCTLFTYLY